jgi:DNA-binding NtrC family response regulator
VRDSVNFPSVTQPRTAALAASAPAGHISGACVDESVAGGPGDGRSMVVADPASQSLVRLLARLAPSDVPVMITGETGTGKEVVARHIHRASGRTGQFLAVNCSAVAEQLTTSQVFAGDAASGNGSHGRREMWFEAADRGTLFLDEVADLSLSLQGQLLRVLQEYDTDRAESAEPAAMDVRIITATNVDLAEAVSAGHFRLDLFYRLNIAQVRLLPLRQRRGDIAPLANHFLQLFGRRLNLQPPSMSVETVAALNQHAWPGNVRELENVIHFALLVAPERHLRVEHLKLSGALPVAHTAAAPAQETVESPLQRLSGLLALLFQSPGGSLFTDLENRIVAEAFRFSGQNQVRAASLLGISRNVLRTLLKKHGLLRR